jgi:hypothetical protein
VSFEATGNSTTDTSPEFDLPYSVRVAMHPSMSQRLIRISRMNSLEVSSVVCREQRQHRSGAVQ